MPIPEIIPPTVVVLLDSGLNGAVVQASENAAVLSDDGSAQSVVVTSGENQVEISE